MNRDDAVLEVLRRLEADNRMMKRTGAAVLAVLAVAFCGAAVGFQGRRDGQEPAPAIQDVLRTRRLEIADAAGKVVAVLHAAEPLEEPGWLTDHHDNGRRKWRAQIEHNRYHGAFTAWWPSGIKQEEGTFDKGRRHGLFTTYHENGQPAARGAWDAGRRTGIWTEWHDNGEKQAEGLYEDDRKTGPWTRWHDNGEPALKVTFVDGAEHGLHVAFYESGQKRHEYNKVRGVLTGPARAWHANGQLHWQGHFDEQGRKHGEHQYWNADGSPDARRTVTYEHGKKVQK